MRHIHHLARGLLILATAILLLAGLAFSEEECGPLEIWHNFDNCAGNPILCPNEGSIGTNETFTVTGTVVNDTALGTKVIEKGHSDWVNATDPVPLRMSGFIAWGRPEIGEAAAMKIFFYNMEVKLEMSGDIKVKILPAGSKSFPSAWDAVEGDLIMLGASICYPPKCVPLHVDFYINGNYSFTFHDDTGPGLAQTLDTTLTQYMELFSTSPGVDEWSAVGATTLELTEVNMAKIYAEFVPRVNLTVEYCLLDGIIPFCNTTLDCPFCNTTGGAGGQSICNETAGCEEPPVCNPSCGPNGTCVREFGGALVCFCQLNSTGPVCNRTIQTTGIASCDPPCVNGGTCVTQDQCHCPPGLHLSGEQCQFNTSCDPVCQNGGTCEGPNLCHCKQGWDGPLCANSTFCNTTLDCPEAPFCNETAGCPFCNETAGCPFCNKTEDCPPTPLGCDPPCINGGCNNELVCVCDLGFEGPSCNDTVICDNALPFGDPNVCSGHGDCVIATGGNTECCCDEGYGGNNCSSPPPVCNPACENGGTCVENNLCLCTQGWDGPICANSTFCNTTLDCPEAPFCNDTAGCPFCNETASCPSCNKTEECPPPDTPPTCEPACENEGTCLEGNACNCPQGFDGPTCSNSTQCPEPPFCNETAGCLDCPFCNTTEGCPFCNETAGCPFCNTTLDCPEAPFCNKTEECPFCNKTEECPPPDTPPTCEPACENEGTCLPDNVCNCPQGFDGPTCSNSTQCPEPPFCNETAGCIDCPFCNETAGCPFCNETASCPFCNTTLDCPPPPEIPTCDPPCDNGGTCTQDELCNCPQGFDGPFCGASTECAEPPFCNDTAGCTPPPFCNDTAGCDGINGGGGVDSQGTPTQWTTLAIVAVGISGAFLLLLAGIAGAACCGIIVLAPAASRERDRRDDERELRNMRVGLLGTTPAGGFRPGW